MFKYNFFDLSTIKASVNKRSKIDQQWMDKFEKSIYLVPIFMMVYIKSTAMTHYIFDSDDSTVDLTDTEDLLVNYQQIIYNYCTFDTNHEYFVRISKVKKIINYETFQKDIKDPNYCKQFSQEIIKNHGMPNPKYVSNYKYEVCIVSP